VIRADLLAGPGKVALMNFIGDRPAMVFASPTVSRIFGDELRDLAMQLRSWNNELITIQTTEQNKTLQTVEAILTKAQSRYFGRNGVFIGVGGGVLLDIVGLAAGLFRRGVAQVRIGTTLLAQVDAAIGIKSGVNVGKAKNLAGLFSPPELVVTDGRFLSTLPQRHIRCGLAEMIKLALVRDEALFTAIETDGHQLLLESRNSETSQRLVDQAIRGMIGELEPNAYETELQRVVDFGHTISPRLESDTNFQLHHGEAVAIDLVYFCIVGQVLGMLKQDAVLRIVALLDRLGIPRWHELLANLDFIASALDAAQAHRGGQLHLPIPTRIGAAQFVSDRRNLTGIVLKEASEIGRVL